jgi:spermidine/putrescine ABC transporter ATP-binding subunit
MPTLHLERISKRFGRTEAVREVSLEIRDGEILTLLGPSGCGKTTTLRCIAGFIRPDSGEIYLDGRAITDLPAERRGIGIVFQNYALWPHMTVRENLAFGLRLRRLPAGEIRRRVEWALSLVRLSGLESRYPRELSGGQQQRVALARALVITPSVLLLDEPLSNLDAQLREEMRFELRDLQKRLGITTVYVTHDQAEALVLSDRIAILNRGELAQVGTPHEIYERPANPFVAGFMGLTTFVDGVVVPGMEAGRIVVRTSDGLNILARRGMCPPGQQVAVALRPEHVRIRPGHGAAAECEDNAFNAVVTQVAYLGDFVEYRVAVGEWVFRIRTPPDIVCRPGDPVTLTIDPDRVIVVPTG